MSKGGNQTETEASPPPNSTSPKNLTPTAIANTSGDDSSSPPTKRRRQKKSSDIFTIPPSFFHPTTVDFSYMRSSFVVFKDGEMTMADTPSLEPEAPCPPWCPPTDAAAAKTPPGQPEEPLSPNPPEEIKVGDWLTREKFQLIKVIEVLQQLPTPPTVVAYNNTRTPNWELASQIVSRKNKTFRPAESCQSQYEEIVKERQSLHKSLLLPRLSPPEDS